MRTPLLLLALGLPVLLLPACGDKDETSDDTSVPTDDTSVAGDDTDDSSTDDSAPDDSAPDDTAVQDQDGDGSPADVDCDDDDPSAYPGATEVCDGVDNDCDGTVDVGASDPSPYYSDSDGDGYGGELGGEACELPTGAVWEGGDCDDGDVDVNPGAAEVCDGVDNDCDGVLDDGDDDVVGQDTWYADSDGDSYGDAGDSLAACEAPSGYVDDDSDCDDSDGGVNPGATEVCDEGGVDEDCDGDVNDDDASVTGTSPWYYDGDGDGYGDAATTLDACEAPTGYVGDDSDCDDSDASLSAVCSWDGSYAGDFDVVVTVTTLGVTDTCSGTGTVDVAEADSPALDGAFTCSFSGIMASLLGSQSITLEGDFDSAVDASGTLSIGSLASSSWTGGFSGNTLTGSFSGSGTYQSYRFTYSGTLDVSR